MLFFTGLPGSSGTILSFRMTVIRLIQLLGLFYFAPFTSKKAPIGNENDEVCVPVVPAAIAEGAKDPLPLSQSKSTFSKK
jgi:hypothetical protein